MFASIPQMSIRAIRSAVSGKKINIEDELEYYGGSLKKAERARKMIGINTRRQAWPGQTASDLCYAACQDLLADFSDMRDKIDALIFVSQSPDYDLPATACILQDRLGLPKACASFDVNQGCAGYVYGLWLGASLCNSGCKNILLLAGDTPKWPRDPQNRIIAPIFGDGGSATLISCQPDQVATPFSLGSDGSGFENLIVPAGRYRLPFAFDNELNAPLVKEITDGNNTPWRMLDVYMDGQKVFEFTLEVVPKHIRQFMEQAKIHPSAIDYFFLHQANAQIVGEIAKKVALPKEKTPTESFSAYGNLSSASIPAAICHLFGPSGTTGNKLFLLCGYGVGMAWASCIWQANNCSIKPVIEVPRPENDMSWQEKIEYWRAKISGASA